MHVEEYDANLNETFSCHVDQSRVKPNLLIAARHYSLLKYCVLNCIPFFKNIFGGCDGSNIIRNDKKMTSIKQKHGHFLQVKVKSLLIT